MSESIVSPEGVRARGTVLLFDRDLDPDLDLIGIEESIPLAEGEEEEQKLLFPPEEGNPGFEGKDPLESSRSKGLYRSSYNINFV